MIKYKKELFGRICIDDGVLRYMKFERMLALALVLAVLCGSMPAFAQEELLIRLPEAIKVIGEEAFCGDDSLGRVVLPQGITEIHSRAFADSSITEINLPSSLTYIADDAFAGCENLVIDFEDGKWYGWALENGYNVSSSPAGDFAYTVDAEKQCVTIEGYNGNDDVVYIPDEIEGYPVTAIGHSAFEESTVSEWILPDSIETIHDDAFKYADLEYIRLPENENLVLKDECFAWTRKLKSIRLPDGLKEMNGRCFHYSGLESVNIPPKIEYLGNDFAYCGNLTEVSFASGALESLDGTFNYTALKKVVLPESVTRIYPSTFDGYTQQDYQGFEIWMGSAVNNLPDLRMSRNKTFPHGAIIYAPEGSYAAEWAEKYENYQGTLYNEVSYGGPGCAEMFGGEHDYELASDTVCLDDETSLHRHKIVYECSRCLAQRTEDQNEPVLGCWRCEAKEAYGGSADIPANKFEFLDRYKLGGEIYYRVRLLADHEGVEAGYEVLFMDEKLQMVTKRETINTLFKTHIYTGSGNLPWEYTETESDYPALEKRAELISSLLGNAQENLNLATAFMELDMCYEKLGSTAMSGLKLLWGDPSGALASLKQTVVPDMDALVTVMHLLLLNKLEKSTVYDAQHYTNSISKIVDSDGFIVCEKAEESLQTFANCVAMRQLCADNSSGIIDEIAACDSAFGVGVRNIMTMLKGAVGVDDNPLAKTGVLVTQTMYNAIAMADEGDADYSGLLIKYIGDLAGIVADASKSSGLGVMADVYKNGNFSLSEFLYVDAAMEKYESVYNAFCLKNTAPVYQAHDALA